MAFFYNPEIHSASATRKIGLSQGIGLELEGPLTSFLSVLEGVNFQSNAYAHQIPVGELLLPPNIRTTNYIYQDQKSQFTPILLDTFATHSAAYQFL